jgi:RNA polymerase sigma-70 factor, ECF subfamily
VSELSDEDLQGLYRYAVCLTRDRDRAYDLVHTVIVRWLATGQSKVDHPCRYLLVAVRNQYFDQHRREQVLDHTALNQNESVVHLGVAALEDTVIRADQVDQIWRLLSDAEREVLFLWAVEGFTVSEISAHTGVPRGTLLARIHRLRQRILALDRVDDLKTMQ